MSMKIKVEKVFHRGEPRVKILEIKGLCYENLPKEYVDFPPNTRFYTAGQPYVFVEMGPGRNSKYCVGDLLQPQEFETLMNNLAICGNRLKEINDKVREMKKTWNGVKEYSI